jgi:alkylhydroperoxidase family enzyme
MAHVDYSAAGIPVRDDLTEAHAELLEHLRAPGTWWTGAERVAIAAESRNAPDCALCQERKNALSPSAVKGEHDSLGALPEVVVDVIHRVRTDPARLSKGWFDGVMAAGVTVQAYVEVISIVTLLAGVDFTTRALGAPPPSLPEPLPGEPSRHRPATTKSGVAWVQMLDPADADGAEADLYPDLEFVPNIMRALSLVPDEARTLHRSSDAHYVAMQDLANPSARRNLDRLQIELVAARVSALNECFY